MCHVCKMPLDDEAAVLAAIDSAIRNGANPAHFEKLLDKVCGTQMEERNETIEEAWEKKYRGED